MIGLDHLDEEGKRKGILHTTESMILFVLGGSLHYCYY